MPETWTTFADAHGARIADEGLPLGTGRDVLSSGHRQTPLSLPSSRRSTRSHAAASLGLCVAMTDVRPLLAVHLPQQIVQRFGGVLVEIAGRLVGEQQRRAHDQRARDRDALLLAARQHARPVLEALAPARLAPGAASRAARHSACGRRAMRIGISAFSTAVNSGSR